ncbi:MAG: hypothetical protein V2A53_10540 [bacterium]
MAVKSKYETQLWQEIQGLKESELLKVVKLVHFFKEEFVGEMVGKKKRNKADIMKYAGLLKDFNAEEEAIFDEATKRCSLFGERGISL